MTGCTSTSLKMVMVSGHFDGFHSGHLDYIIQSLQLGCKLLCIVSTDKQLRLKKGKVNVEESYRWRILDLILRGMNYEHCVFLNLWDDNTTQVTEALRHFKPDIFFRGYDKTLETMPPEERKVCEELGIEIIHAKNRIGERHSSEIFK